MSHPQEAKIFTADQERTQWHDKSLWFVRSKRDKAVNKIPEWEKLRQTASQIKAHTMANLDKYLIEFEKNAKSKGIHVHWAKDTNEHNLIVDNIIKKHNGKKIVKSKSMLTEECHLNPFLEKKGYEVTDTDLGERIVQLRNEPPSHIVLPAIHLKKEDVSDTFHEHMNTEKGNHNPEYLTEQARQDLRKKFLEADIGITGVNFAIANTGSITVCTNEGNADLGTSLPKVHIACMGMEKIIPKFNHLGVFSRLLARSATGQAITTYTSHFHQAKKDGEMHVVIVDNGRSKILASDDFRKSLSCIRCGACMNTCPVYRRSGGHSYKAVVPGPIGSVLNPHNNDKFNSLPFASSLCGSCTDVCPVKINLHEQLLKWRQVISEKGKLAKSKKISMKLAGKLFSSPKMYRLAGKILRYTPSFLIKNKIFNPWVKQREMPEIPKKPFRDIYKEREK